MKKVFKTVRNASIFALATAGVAGVAHAELIVDEFNGLQALSDSTTNGEGKVALNYAAPGILGGNRDIFITKTGEASTDIIGQSTNTNVAFVLGNNRFEWSNQESAYGEVVVRWDGVSAALGADDGAAGEFTRAQFDATTNFSGLGLDMAAAGSFLQFLVLKSDIGFDFRVELFTDADSFAYVDLASQAHLNEESTPIPLSAFTATCGLGFPVPNPAEDVNEVFCSNTDFSLNDINVIQISLRTRPSDREVDTTIDQARLIPEPGTLALAGLTLVGLALQRRRKYA